MDTLEYVQNVYKGVPADENPFRLNCSAFISEKELNQKITAVLDAAAKDKGGSVEQVKTAQIALVEYLENIFTKSRVENFNANTHGKNPMKTLPPAHADSAWALGDDGLLNEYYNFDELSNVLLGSDFAVDENALHPDSITDVTVLDAVVSELQSQLTFKSDNSYILENGMLVHHDNEFKPSGGLEALVKTLNGFAQSLIPITDEAIEAGLVPLRVVEGDAGKLDLPTQLWNARLNGDNEEVKVVTQKMFKQIQSDLASLFFEKNQLPKIDAIPLNQEIVDFITGYYPAANTEAIAPKAFETITQRGRNLPNGSDFVQSVINQFFEGVYKSESNVDALPHTLTEFYKVTSELLTPKLVENPAEKEWQKSSFNAVLKYAKETGLNGFHCDKVEDFYQLASWKGFPELREKVQAVISARTKSVDAVKSKQSELMAFLKKEFYEKPEPPQPIAG